VALMWCKLDDKLHTHHKPRKAGLEAMGLWGMCLSYCGDQLTDGWVPRWYVQTWAPGRKGIKLADQLVAAGLWTRSKQPDGEEGWTFHDYHDQNPTREKVLDDRENEKTRKAEQRKKSREEAEKKAAEQQQSESADTEPPATEAQVSQQVSHRDTQRDSGGVSDDPDPTRPDPTRSSGPFGPGVVGSGKSPARDATAAESRPTDPGAVLRSVVAAVNGFDR
jgi:hypothetical protein